MRIFKEIVRSKDVERSEMRQTGEWVFFLVEEDVLTSRDMWWNDGSIGDFHRLDYYRSVSDFCIISHGEGL